MYKVGDIVEAIWKNEVSGVDWHGAIGVVAKIDSINMCIRWVSSPVALRNDVRDAEGLSLWGDGYTTDKQPIFKVIGHADEIEMPQS